LKEMPKDGVIFKEDSTVDYRRFIEYLRDYCTATRLLY